MTKKIFIALDNMNREEILDLVDELKDYCMFKLNDAFVKYGPDLIKEIHAKGGEIFLDMKFHDIPNTIGNHCVGACMNEVYMFNVHASGGFEMMKKAKEAVDIYPGKKPLLIAVTILTSMDETSMRSLGINSSVEEQVKKLALQTKKAGFDGVVCSPNEAAMIKELCGKDFLTITPGIRPNWASNDDQKRITTPKDAVNSDYLVIGRPIIQAEKYGMTRAEAAKKIIDELNS